MNRGANNQNRQGQLAFEVDGVRLHALAGQTVAAALVAERLWQFRDNPVLGDPRGPYCGMGVCFECELEIDGVPGMRSCLMYVKEGMVIRRGWHGHPDPG